MFAQGFKIHRLSISINIGLFEIIPHKWERIIKYLDIKSKYIIKSRRIREIQNFINIKSDS